MKIIRRFVFTAVFLVAAVMLIRAAQENREFLYMFYPSIIREIVLSVLISLTEKLEYILWERVVLVAVIWAAVTLVADIILQENLLRWVSGVTMVASLALLLYVAAGGLNVYSHSVAEDMRLDTNHAYTASDLQLAAEYYRDQANDFAEQVERDSAGNFDAGEFEALAADVGNGLHNMTRVSYIFGGTPSAIDKLSHTNLIPADGVVMPLTGEVAVNENLDDAILPFFMTHEAARQLSVMRNDDATFVAILACMGSDNAAYRYSGSMMAYRLCLQQLEALDDTTAYKVASGASELLQRDLDATDWWPEASLGEKLMYRLSTDEVERPDAVELLEGWYTHLTTLESVEEEDPAIAA